MESLSQSIHQPLEFLIYTSIVLIIITGVFLIKILIDLSGLVKTVQDFVQATQTELEPTIREIKATLVNINQISSSVSNQISDINSKLKKGAKTVLDATAFISSRTKDFSKIARKALKEGFYLLLNNKK